ncbi:glycosyltransferase family 4 protein [Natrarchaeobius oligotrophus]|uniref:Glycosyltransferase family 1 protein n=1 Tax=Natrarchaeobius chitinivorans TaxID=1679083 RepID=A0A3N6MVP0_NATCH|nr:glycosyltransferase [Natrarchaeobius chitinivorans]RQH02041.1 glycosyltransferase family 1 protein [Natrarchaeobius chitinivorans]
MDEDICVVTQPLGEADPTATGELLEILSEITSVSLVTIALSDAGLRAAYDVTELSDRDFPDSIPIAAIYFLFMQLRMSRAVRRRDEEIVLFFGPVAYVLPILVARLSGKTVIVEPRANVPLALRIRWERRVPLIVARALAGCVWLLERIGYRLSNAIVTYTPAMATELGLEGYEHKLYPNGARFIDADEFGPRVAYDDRDAVVGYLGRMDEEKGVRTLAAVATRLPSDVTFRFVGGGALSDWLSAEVADEVRDGRVEIEGWVDHDRVPHELSRMRLLVLPSHPTEGLPTTILESFACGTPVYATPVSGVPDVVREGETGALMRTRDPDEIATELANLLDDDSLSEMSRNCRALIQREFTFDAAVARYERILESVSARAN